MLKPAITRDENHFVGRFSAMASPCEILVETTNATLAKNIIHLAYAEAIRIERKFSRYRDDNLIYKINHSSGSPIKVDDEIANLLNYADQCFKISDGMFDITSGILRKVWHFDCTDNLPDAASITKLLPAIGWEKVKWECPFICLPKGMEIDFGGIGKEYAVDRSAQIVKHIADINFLINFGGDLYSNLSESSSQFPGWIIGVEGISNKNRHDALPKHYRLKQGGIATSGDSRRYLLKDGIRYSHILDPRTGWPVTDCPHSITVIADTCTDAGILSTLAMLHGSDAESFLAAQDIQFWCQR